MKKRAHILVSGRVQGVCYRMYARDKALSLDLKGWVRNLPDGRVEIVAEGEGEKIALFLVLIRTGPSSAQVTDLQADWTTLQAEEQFSIRYG